jgi:transaldolase
VKHQDILEAGTSIWLDDLSRSKLTGSDTHSLPHRIKNDGVRGVTTNPSIFGAAIVGADEYSADIASLSGKSVDEVVRTLTTDDVRAACDLFAEIYSASKGVDGRVSIEVDPRLANKTQETIDEGIALHALVARPNVMIKVPATKAGLPAITALIGRGISVNVTLIFSLERYGEVIDAFTAGMEQAKGAGLDLASIHSVASFFISRIDNSVDKELKAIGNTDLLGKVAVANAHRAYALFLDKFNQLSWKALEESGALVQRPLWASTGVKDPAYSDTLYVDTLVAPHTVNTMPQSTLDAFLDHGVVKSDAITSHMESASKILAELSSLGISLDAITAALEADGVKKFEDAWVSLLADVEKVMTP